MVALEQRIFVCHLERASPIIDKLGWLVDYQSELIRWHQMTVLTRTLETQLKKLGINQHSLTYFQENEFAFAEGELLNFQQHICDYVVTQSSHIKDEKLS